VLVGFTARIVRLCGGLRDLPRETRGRFAPSAAHRGDRRAAPITESAAQKACRRRNVLTEWGDLLSSSIRTSSAACRGGVTVVTRRACAARGGWVAREWKCLHAGVRSKSQRCKCQKSLWIPPSPSTRSPARWSKWPKRGASVLQGRVRVGVRLRAV
jgi:hypothetical protein